MTALELFNRVTSGPWNTVGKDVQFRVQDRTLFFQCSNGKVDWLRNFNFPKSVYKEMPTPFRAHSGFLAAWHDCRDIVMRYEFDRIVGYSHGAALALFAHEDCIFHNIQVDTIVFGCPRVFAPLPESVRYRFSGVTRYTSKGDVVTTVPPKSFGFEHVGREIVLTGSIRKEEVSWISYLSHHSPSVYRQRLAVL